MKRNQPLIPGMTYHIYNRAVGNEKLFKEKENYLYFLKKLQTYLIPVMNFYSYTLIPNHFHLMVQIKDEGALNDLFKLLKKKTFNPTIHNLSDFVMEQVSNCLNGYAKSFNKKYKRMGGLFMAGTKRNELITERYLRNLLLYVHKNAVHHGLTKKIGVWPFDGYNEIVSNSATWLCASDAINFFGSREEFIRCHTKLTIDIKRRDWDV